MKKTLLVLVGLAAAVSAQPARVPGVLGFDSQEAIIAPESVEAGKDFQVTILTSGDGCVSQGDTSVVLTETGADVFVFDETVATHPGVVCTRILKEFRHSATLRFTHKGEAVIRVWGRQQSGNSPLGAPVVVEKRVRVL